MPAPSARELLAQIEAFTSDPPAEAFSDAELLARLRTAARHLSLSIETPTEAVARVLTMQPAEGAVVRVALKVKLFTALAKNGTGKTKEQLLQEIKIEPVLMDRILHSLAAFGAIKEVGEREYTLSPSFSLLADETFAQGVEKSADFIYPVYNALSGFLESTNYTIPDNPADTAVQRAFNAKGKTLFEILEGMPESAHGFGVLMHTWGERNIELQSLYPVRDRLVEGFGPSESAVMFVDVGGGFGQKTVSLKKALPDLPGRCVVQDMPHMIAAAPKVDGIEYLAHDFFEEQPIKGARAYYLRQCLHNWTDDKCILILKRLKEAMIPSYSRVLLHEIVMPERGASAWEATQDINMMALCATCERTESQWKRILHAAEFKITNTYLAIDGVSESVIEAEISE